MNASFLNSDGLPAAIAEVQRHARLKHVAIGDDYHCFRLLRCTGENGKLCLLAGGAEMGRFASHAASEAKRALLSQLGLVPTQSRFTVVTPIVNKQTGARPHENDISLDIFKSVRQFEILIVLILYSL